MTAEERKLLFLLASVTRSQLKEGCREQKAITEYMQAARGGAKEHIREQAKLQRELRGAFHTPRMEPGEYKVGTTTAAAQMASYDLRPKLWVAMVNDGVVGVATTEARAREIACGAIRTLREAHHDGPFLEHVEGPFPLEEPEPRTLDQLPWNGLLCTVCNEPQRSTPSGDTCVNQHGGAPGRKP